jgi:hypothetical protein
MINNDIWYWLDIVIVINNNLLINVKELNIDN